MQVFLDLPLSGVLTGKVIYEHKHNLWHEVTICDASGKPARRLVLQLTSSRSNPDKARVFNEKLSRVFEIIRSTHAEEKEGGEREGGEEGLPAPVEKEPPVFHDDAEPQLVGRGE